VTAVVGNLYDKYGTKNPAARLLMRGFLSTVTALGQKAAPRTVLEVGCGEGHLTQHLFERLSPERFAACDLSLARVSSHVDPRIEFRTASADELPYANASFDLVVCCEVLEHLLDPTRALGELARVTKRWALISTPNEPLFRALNLLRGAYLADLGNTPGHVQHFTPTLLTRLVSSAFRVRQLRKPLPWVVLLAERQMSDLRAPDVALR
jgi:2-polyprenyl-3-methyl-5-hydroxy-6-metoxy-1,4-benzoquinol methylase